MCIGYTILYFLFHIFHALNIHIDLSSVVSLLKLSKNLFNAKNVFMVWESEKLLLIASGLLSQFLGRFNVTIVILFHLY